VPDRTYKGTIAHILDLMGRKQNHTEDPFEKVDSRILEFIVPLEDAGQLRINQRVDVVIAAATDDQGPPALRGGGPAPAKRRSSAGSTVLSAR
jgi:hypothetical protein